MCLHSKPLLAFQSCVLRLWTAWTYTTFEGRIRKGLKVRRPCSPEEGSCHLVHRCVTSRCWVLSPERWSAEVAVAFSSLLCLSFLCCCFRLLGFCLLGTVLIGLIYFENEQWNTVRFSPGIKVSSFHVLFPGMSPNGLEAAQSCHLILLPLSFRTCKIKGFTFLIPSKCMGFYYFFFWGSPVQVRGTPFSCGVEQVG